MSRALVTFLAGGAAVLLVAEALFRVLPVSTSTSTGYYVDPEILGYPPHHRWKVATGWDLRHPQTLESNNVGFVAEHDFVRNPDAVGLIGDSYVEASMLDAPDRPGIRLEHALGGARPVYAMGAPGTALLDYAERIRWARTQFGIRDFVLLMERGDVMQSLCGSGNVHSQCLDRVTLAPRTERLATASASKRLLRRSALAQYLTSQLKLEPAGLLDRLFPARRPPPPVLVPFPAPDLAPGLRRPLDASVARRVDTVTRTFFERAAPYLSGRLVIVLDCDRRRLARGDDITDPARDRFISLARAAGASVVDTEPLYRRHFAASPLSLEVGPYDGHLNALGVRLMTAAAAQALEGAKPFATPASQTVAATR